MTAKSLADCTFMIVDDVRSTRISLLGILKEIGNPEVLHAENGHEALSLLQETNKRIDCIISDFNMPVMHGLKMVKMIRTGHRGIRRDIPIMMLTGHGDRQLLGVALALDVNAFVLKPAQKNILLERIVKLMAVQNSNESWLKPVESYICVDTESPIKNILKKPSLSEKLADADSVAKAIAGRQKRQNIKTYLMTAESPAEEVPPAALSDLLGGDGEKTFPCSVDRIPPNAVLVKDIVGSKGERLLKANVKLTAGMIDRLKDLKELGEPIHSVWIKI